MIFLIMSVDLPKTSKEPYDISKKLNDNHVIVDAAAGSGKTTSNLHISFFIKWDLLLTYNTNLKLETCDKVENII